MKLLTLNTHSLQETDYPRKLEEFATVIEREQPDILALQEVNQSMTAPPAGEELLTGWTPCSGGAPVRQDNHAAKAALRLREKGISCSWTWISAKIGYEKYDEGMAFLCLNHEIEAVDSFYISNCQDYHNWKTRRALGIRIKGLRDWFYTVHMGWWQDEEEPFYAQWKQLETILRPKKEAGTLWLAGDFNSPAGLAGQGWEFIRKNGWTDTYDLALEKDRGITVKGCIDGWEAFYKQLSDPEGMRIDYIWCNRPIPVSRSRTLFNGIAEPEISDHFGVLIEF